MTDLDLRYLATEATKEERSEVSHEDLLSVHRENIEMMKSALDKELYAATIAALQYADSYWDYASYLHGEQKEGENHSYFTVRVRLDEKRNNLGVIWQKRYPVKGRSKEGRLTNSRHISKGARSSYRYTRTAFGQIRDWEYSAVEEAENHFEKIRRQIEAIGKLRRNIDALDRLVEKTYSS